MKTESVTKTVVCGLQSSNRKNEVLEEVIKNWQKVASHCADVAVGYQRWQYSGQPSTLYSHTKKFKENLHSSGRGEAADKVRSAFESWMKQPQNNEHPRSEFGDGNYCRFSGKTVHLEKNDGVFAVKLNIIPYNPEWFNLKYGEHQKDILQECFEGEGKLGAYEIHYNGEGSPQIHIAVTREIDVLEPSEVETVVGVDIGENFLYALGTAPKTEAYIESGAEFRHHREKLSQRKDREQAKGNLRKVKKISGERKKYTDWVTHTASRGIVDWARQFDAPAIALEDLKNYRETAKNPIHDWPFAEIQEKAMYKATEEGIPVVKVDPAHTSQLCNDCGEMGERNGNGFNCPECKYESQSDINAAFNIANRAAGSLK